MNREKGEIATTGQMWIEGAAYIVRDADRETESIGDREAVEKFDSPSNNIVSSLAF